MDAFLAGHVLRALRLWHSLLPCCHHCHRALGAPLSPPPAPGEGGAFTFTFTFGALRVLAPGSGAPLCEHCGRAGPGSGGRKVKGQEGQGLRP